MSDYRRGDVADVDGRRAVYMPTRWEWLDGTWTAAPGSVGPVLGNVCDLAGPEAEGAPGETRRFTRLSVLVNDDCAAHVAAMREQGMSATEVVRRALSLHACIQDGGRIVPTAPGPSARVELSDAIREALAEHDDPPGWTSDDNDMPVYECNCGDRSPALDRDYICPSDAEDAAAWHRGHVAAHIERIFADRVVWRTRSGRAETAEADCRPQP